MTTPHLNERVLALCALIAEEKDPGKFLLLVRELDDAFEKMGVKFEHAQSTTAHRKANVSYIYCPIIVQFVASLWHWTLPTFP